MTAPDHLQLPESSAVEFVMAGYEELERQMLTFMDVVPFVNANLSVVSSRLVPVLMESCSLIDSILRRTAVDEHTAPKHISARAGSLLLHDCHSVLLVSPLRVITPFQAARDSPPEWWSTYNKIKHDRMRNHEAATFPVVVSALVALHQVIVRTRMFGSQLAKRGWVNDQDDVHVAELLTMDLVGSGPPDMPIEARLVVTPLARNFVELQDGRWVFDSDFQFSRRVANYIWEHEGW